LVRTVAVVRKRLNNINFANPKLQILWAAFAVLETDEALEFVRVLGELLGAGSFPASRSKDRQADAIACLREAAEIVGHSTSIGEYETLRKERTDLELVASGSIRTRLAAGWNDCLKRAELEPVVDGDAPVQKTGRCTFDEAIAALKLCREMLGEVPSGKSYLTWARRPDVRALPGYRPATYSPFYRIFGSWHNALKEAGLVEDAINRNGRHDPATWRYEDNDLTDGIRVVADHLGRPPRLPEYIETRNRLLKTGVLKSLPSATAITTRYRFWVVAVEAAGLNRDLLSPKRRADAKAPVYGDDELLAWMRRAYAEVGEPFTMKSYDAWRVARVAEVGAGTRTIPSGGVVAKRLGGWPAACKRMVEEWVLGDETADEEPTDEKRAA
jgi:hypothetical protein